MKRETDPLTGLYNRQLLQELLTWEVARADRHQLPLTMLILDIDHLKQVNDAYGHSVGDNLLKFFAAVLASSGRRGDFAFRSGGDEFSMLMPDTDLKGGLHVREKIRKRIGASGFIAALGLARNVSVTIAVCEYEGGAGRHTFMKRVEEALSRAKNDGDDGLSAVALPV
jgi:diguanylate cyclase (GGDEF)-like protein